MKRIIPILLLALTANSADAGQFLSTLSAIAAATAPTGPAPQPTPPPAGICDNCSGTGRLGDGTVSVPCPVCGGDGKIEAAQSGPADINPDAPQVGDPIESYDGAKERTGVIEAVRDDAIDVLWLTSRYVVEHISTKKAIKIPETIDRGDFNDWIDSGYLTLLPRPKSKPPAARKAKTPTPAKTAAGAYYPVRTRWWSGCSSWRHLTQGEHAGLFDATWLQTLSNAEIQSLHSDAHENRIKWQYVVRGSRSACPQGTCPTTTRTVRRGLFRR